MFAVDTEKELQNDFSPAANEAFCANANHSEEKMHIFNETQRKNDKTFL